MSLPVSAQAFDVVKLSGGEVKVTGLTMRQMRECRGLGENEADIRAISYATLTPVPEVESWFETASTGDVQTLIAAIFRVSGADGAATFPGGTSDDAVAQRPATG